jgi:GTP-binding protein HflX
MTNAHETTTDVADTTDGTIDLDPDFSLEADLEATVDWENDPEDEPTVGAMELAERHALRRVAGLSTELEDISEVE